MLIHSFDRFYVVTKFILPSIGDLKFSKLNYDNTCAYMDNKYRNEKLHVRSKDFLQNYRALVNYYKRLIKSYNQSAYYILENEIN